ncbi:MAG: flagellar hook assembly protein FlgD [Bdellovibrionaceae bacterium]|nr:flagellar hook assembly protein FlgD [Pseudobdellovibrionaceae bacterium]MBX3033060.1 flagellar hook assembly protein FlgD [Pseudobdellovibrionaceae bacterium]
MGTMGVKLGTKAFGQTSEKPVSTNDMPSNLSAHDMDKLGGENVGEVLNKIADPNWVDPSKKMRTSGNDKLDKDAFFKLMIAQMKNQDPTNPLKPHEMSAQLANFSSLEQMQNINQTLNEMKNGQKPTEQFQALNLLGKAVSGDSSKLVRSKGDKEHDFRFNLPKAASEVTVKVRNSDGDIVRTYDLKNLKEGQNKITWNGNDDRDLSTRPDEYTFIVEAKDIAGQKFHVKSDFEGVISGVNYTPEGPVLLVGNQTVRMSDVKKIVDPSLMRNDQNVRDVTAQDLKKADDSAQTEKGNAGKASEGAVEEAKPKLMDNVSLSREMMSRLQKETQPGG